MALIRGNEGLNIRFYVRDPEKAHPIAEPRVSAYFASKSVQGPWLYRVARTPKKGKKTSRVNTFGAQSHACAETESPESIVTNFCTYVRVHDIITSANFYDCRLWGLSVVGVKV